MLPTPHANASTGPGAQGRDGGDNLQTAVTLLPTPTSVDHKASRNYQADGSKFSSDRHDGMTLTDAMRLLPTPNASDHNAGRSTHARGNPTVQGAVSGIRPEEAARHMAAGRLPGVPTDLRFTDGKQSSDGPHPHQLTIGDA
jgi:hypothetical protein